MKTHIKICGIKTPDEARMVSSLGVDVIGLVFATSSRQVTLVKAKEIIAVLKDTQVVLVFKDQAAEVVNDIANTLRPHAIQVYDNQTYTLTQGIQIIRSGPLNDLPSHPKTDAFLIDSRNPGSGTRWDWQPLPQTHLPIWVAGGLDPLNVAGCIQTLKPFGVDVSSGVETDGQKDFDRLKAFVKAVKGARHDKT